MNDELYIRMRVLSSKGIIIQLTFEEHDMMHIRMKDINENMSCDMFLSHDSLLESVSDRVKAISYAIDKGLEKLQTAVNRKAMRS